ncbi:MAG: hypothetical protein QM664_15455 [Flavihumibacter sp.]
MRNNLNVVFSLDRLHCHDEGDGWGSAEPYLWTVYFKIDGETCRLNDSLMLEGTATVFTTPGSHGNLGDTDVDAGDNVAIPAAIGRQSMNLIPIPVPDWVKAIGTDDVAAVAGCIAILMEEDNVSDDGANAGHQSLNVAVQDALNGIIPTLGFTNQEISDEDMEALTSKIQSRVKDAIKSQQNIFENIWSWLNADDFVGSVVWKFSGDALLAGSPIALQQRWRNEGDWELFGSVSATEIPACPANLVNDIFEKAFGSKAGDKSMEAMYAFRSNEMKKNAGLANWWQIARNNAHYLGMALTNKETAEAAMSVFKSMPAILQQKDKPLDAVHYDNIRKVLTRISELNTADRTARQEIKRALSALAHIKTQSLQQGLAFLSAAPPARYPLRQRVAKKG